MRTGTDLDQLVDQLHAGRCGQAADLLQRLFAVAPLVPVQNADKDTALQLDAELFSLRFSQLQSAVGWAEVTRDSLGRGPRLSQATGIEDSQAGAPLRSCVKRTNRKDASHTSFRPVQV